MFIKQALFKNASPLFSFTALLLSAAFLSGANAQAQTQSAQVARSGGEAIELAKIPHEKKMPAVSGVDEHGEVLSAHDLPKNDPSPKGQLTLPKERKQRSILAFGVDAKIDANIRRGLSAKTLKSLSPFYPPALEATHGPAEIPELNPHPSKFTFLDAVEDASLFEFLKIHQHRYTPKLEYGPSLVNADHEYKGISDRAFGFCWGFSTLDRYFSSLAFFDPTLPREKSLEFYRHKIRQIVRGEAVVIPGFANFREFSLVPELEFYLKLNAMELWRNRAANWSSIKIFLHASRPATKTELDTTVKDLETRIARGELPKIIFSALVASKTIMGLNTDIHVVLPYAVEHRADRSIRIHLWDINFYTETLVRSPKYLEITPDHKIHYAPWYEPTKPYAAVSDLVSSIQITPENDRETLIMMLGIKKFCSKAENAKYCGPNGND